MALALLRQPVVMDRKDIVPFIPSAPWAVANHFAGSILREERLRLYVQSSVN